MSDSTQLFPTFSRWWRRLGHTSASPGGWDVWLRRISPWISTPWWISDTIDSKRRGLIRILSTASRERLAFQPLVQGLAQEDRGWYRRRLRRLGRRLAQGVPLSDALEQTPGVVSDEQLLAIRFGEQSGTLASSLDDLLVRGGMHTESLRHQLRQVTFYGTTVFTIGIAIVAFILVKIMPSFQAIFEDFDLELPSVTILFVRIADFAINYWFLFVLPWILLVWLLRSQRSQNWLRRRFFSRFLPPVARLRVAELLNLLAITAEAGRPLAGAISTLARYHYDSFLRQKLLFVRNEIEQGADLWESFVDARLINARESDVLKLAPSPDTCSWAMRQLADMRRGRVARTLNALLAIAQPLLVVGIGAIVLLVALACLAPLVSLMEGLSG